MSTKAELIKGARDLQKREEKQARKTRDALTRITNELAAKQAEYDAANTANEDRKKAMKDLRNALSALENLPDAP